MKRQSYFNAGLLRYTKAEEQVLKSRLEAIRATITHPAEKGRSVEVAVREFLRSMLPAEYGLSTGFIAYHAPNCIEEREFTQDNMPVYECRYCPEKDEIRVSPQIDIIIYDALRFGPIVRLEACDVFPAEAVYAYVEVKSRIDTKKDRRTGLTPLESILVQSRELRSNNVRLYHASVPGTYTKTVLVPFPLKEAIPIRSFVFILDAARNLGTAKDILALLERLNGSHNGFISGMYIQGKGYYQSVHLEPDVPKPERSFTLDDSPSTLARFKNQLFAALSRYPRPPERWTPAIDRYYMNRVEISPTVRLVQEPGKPYKTLHLVF